MKKIKKLIIVISMLLVAFLVANVTSYAITKKNLFNYFFSGEEEELDEIWTRLQKDGEQSVVIDDYTITLEGYLYDGATYKGYATFSVKREGKDMRDEIAGETVIHGVYSTFGENERFTFDVNGSLTCDTSFKKEEDVMYVYYEFDVGDIWGFDDKILICDYETHGSDWRKEGKAMFEFCLNDNVGTNMYEIENEGLKYHMYISLFGIKIISVNPMENIEELILHFDDGKKEKIIDKKEAVIGKYYTSGYENGSYVYSIWLGDIFEIKRIQEVTLNGKKLRQLSEIEKENVEKIYKKIFKER